MTMLAIRSYDRFPSSGTTSIASTRTAPTTSATPDTHFRPTAGPGRSRRMSRTPGWSTSPTGPHTGSRPESARTSCSLTRAGTCRWGCSPQCPTSPLPRRARGAPRTPARSARSPPGGTGHSPSSSPSPTSIPAHPAGTDCARRHRAAASAHQSRRDAFGALKNSFADVTD